VPVGRPRVRVVDDDRVRRLAAELRAARDALWRALAAVDRGRIALEELRLEARVAQPVREDARHEGALVVDGGLLLDERREGHEAVPPDPDPDPELALRTLDGAGVLRHQRGPVTLEALDHRLGDGLGGAVAREIVRCRIQVPLEGRRVDPERLRRRGVERERPEGGRRANAEGLEALGHLDRPEALGEGHLDPRRAFAP